LKFEEKYRKESLESGQMQWIDRKGTIAWRSPSNIALIKYWGKHGNQLPQNPSLSFVLDKSFTETRLNYQYCKENSMKVNFTFEGKSNPEFEKRIMNFMRAVSSFLPFLNQFEFNIESCNSFPHSSGIASSASSMSALALCLLSMEEEITGKDMDRTLFLQKTSFLSRLGSGSASRSVYDGYVVWGKHKYIPESTDELSVKLTNKIDSKFIGLKDAILITCTGKKKVSSSSGHQLMNEHPFAEARFLQAKLNLQVLLDAMKTGDEQRFISVVENEALSLHAMMMTSSDGFTLMNENTWNIINLIRKYRKENNVFITFTLDAGPNVHLLYQKDQEKQISRFIHKELLQFCENGKWIDDKAGDGPKKLS
jgi:diphosphomevalonate decarboxylase